MPAPVDTSDPFRALSDPTRRAIVDLLAAGPLPVRMIAARFPAISRPAVSKHLRILREGGLVREERSGRERFYRLDAAALAGPSAWLEAVSRAPSPSRRGSAGKAPSASTARGLEAEKKGKSRRPPEPRQRPVGPRPRSPESVAVPGDDWKSW